MVGFIVVDQWLMLVEFVKVDCGKWQIGGGGVAMSGLALKRGRR